MRKSGIIRIEILPIKLLKSSKKNNLNENRTNKLNISVRMKYLMQ
jgi:hypothetical protein